MITRSACVRVGRDPEVPEPALELRAVRPSTEAERAAHRRRARTSLIDAEWEWLLRRAETREVNDASDPEAETSTRRTLPPPPFFPEAASVGAPASLEPVHVSLAAGAADEGPPLEAAISRRTGRGVFGKGLVLVAAALVSLIAILWLRAPVQSSLLASAAPAPRVALPPEMVEPLQEVGEREAPKPLENQAPSPALPEPAPASSAQAATVAPGGASRERARKKTVRQWSRGSVSRKPSRVGSDNPY